MIQPPTSPGTAPALIALGSNLGDRLAHLHAAFAALARIPGTTLHACSRPIETEPLGPPGQGPYLNAAALIHTELPPRPLLAALLAIERERGRRRDTEPARWGPRTLDLDIILYDDLIIDEPAITIPHPRMHERPFVLRPAAAIAPQWLHPTRRQSIAQLLRDIDLPDA